MSLNIWTNNNKCRKIGPEYMAAGDQGQIVYSSDRQHWSQCDTNSTANLFALDGVPGFILAGGNALMKSTDGRIFRQITNLPKWVNLSTGLLYPLTIYRIQVVSISEAYLGCNYGIILHTIDGGLTWESIDMKSPATICFGMYWRDSLTGWVATVDGNIRKTTDGGHTWTGSSYAPGIALRNIRVNTSGVGYACGDARTFFKTIDHGLTWFPIYLPELNNASIPDNFREMAVLSDLELYLVGNDGLVIHSGDGGMNWTNVSNPYNNWNGVDFESSLSGVIVGGTSTASTNDGGHTWTLTNGSPVITSIGTTFAGSITPPTVPAATSTTTSTGKKKP